jgi:hypothetical protein
MPKLLRSKRSGVVCSVAHSLEDVRIEGLLLIILIVRLDGVSF